MARAMPTRLGSVGKFRAQGPLEGNHELTRRSGVALPTFVMRQKVAIDNFRLPFCVGIGMMVRTSLEGRCGALKKTQKFSG